MVKFISSLPQKFDAAAEKYFKNVKLQKTLFLLVLLLAFIMMLTLNLMYPETPDDVLYTHIYKHYNLSVATEMGLEPITNIHDLCVSLGRHYMEWSGRLVAHFFLQVFLNFGLTVIKVVNALVYTALIYFMYKMSVPDKKYRPAWLIFIILAMWAFNPSTEESMLWLAGSCVYMWMGVIVLLLLLPVKKYIYGETEYKSRFFAAAMFILGILAGNSSENTAVGLAAVMVMFFIYMKYNKIKVPKWFVSSFVGEIIGAIILIASPGNFARIGETDLSATAGFSKFYLYLSRINNTTICFIDFMLPLLITVALLFVIRASIPGQKRDIQNALIFTLGSLITAYCMVVSPSFPYRAWFTIAVFMIIAAGILFNSFERENKTVYTCTFVVLALCAIPFALSLREMLLYVKSGEVFMILVNYN